MPSHKLFGNYLSYLAVFSVSVFALYIFYPHDKIHYNSNKWYNIILKIVNIAELADYRSNKQYNELVLAKQLKSSTVCEALI